MGLDFEFKNGNSRAVLLFHGLTGSPFELKKYGVFLNKRGFDVYANSLPGHGEKASDIYTVQYQDWLNFAYAKFEELYSKYDEVYISGLCLGAVLAIYTGIKFKEKVKGVIALSTTLYLDGWRLPWYSFLMPLGLSTIIRFYYNYPECEPHGIKNEKVRSVVKKLLSKGDVGMNDFPMTGIYELIKLSNETIKKLPEFNVPILLIHSQHDDLTSVKSAQVVYKKIKSQDKELIILNNSYHMVLYDNEKEFVFNKAIEFLDNHSKIKEEQKCIIMS